MSKKTIIILHNEKESKIELNLELCDSTSYNPQIRLIDCYTNATNNMQLFFLNPANPNFAFQHLFYAHFLSVKANLNNYICLFDFVWTTMDQQTQLQQIHHLDTPKMILKNLK